MPLSIKDSAEGSRRIERFGGAVPATNLDLVLSVIFAFGVPAIASWLFDVTGGAIGGLLVYYGLACILLVYWRKGTLDYRLPSSWPWGLFLFSLLLPLANAAINWGNLPNYSASFTGVLATALIWAPLNGALEQLSWLYVLDAWRNRWRSGPLRWVGLAVGILLLLSLVTLIHLLYWSRFLPLAQPNAWSWAAIPLNIILTAAYVLLYYRARSFLPVFIIHFLVDLQLVLLAHYSIIPDLF